MGSTLCYKHLSYCFSSELGLLFQDIFPNSQIAKKLTIEKTKMAYSITHGLLPYFHNQVEQLVSSAKYVVGFKQTKWQQGTFLQLLGHATAKDNLNNDILPQILQVSMNGPSVNWKFFDALEMMTLRKNLKLNFFGNGVMWIACGTWNFSKWP